MLRPQTRMLQNGSKPVCDCCKGLAGASSKQTMTPTCGLSTNLQQSWPLVHGPRAVAGLVSHQAGTHGLQDSSSSRQASAHATAADCQQSGHAPVCQQLIANRHQHVLGTKRGAIHASRKTHQLLAGCAVLLHVPPRHPVI